MSLGTAPILAAGHGARLAAITDELVAAVERLHFGPPVACVYDPLVYARTGWDAYCHRYGEGPREVLLVGMNPGPFGMAQVGVPFGEVALVRDWLGIRTAIGQPPLLHPKRPVDGFDCSRSEVSGARVWGWARDRFGTPAAFFERFFILNYCPLVFMEASGRNLTPDKLARAERGPLFAACDAALLAAVGHFQPRFVLGVGQFAESRIRAVLGNRGDLKLGCLPHPSPASPQANRGWAELMDRALLAQGVPLPKKTM